MPLLKQRLANSNSAITMLLVAAVVVALSTMAAGFVVYFNTQRLISASDWVLHTQEVLSSLQRSALLTERIEYRSHQYLLTSEEDQLNRARISANNLRISVAHIQALVVDNPTQVSNVRTLAAQADRLDEILGGFNAKSQVPEKEVEDCQHTISSMTDIEQTLLKERSLSSQRSSYTSIATEITFVGLLLVTLMVLFAFLLRDALRRLQTDKQMSLAHERLAETVKELEDRANESALLRSARDELQLGVDLRQVYDAAASGFSRFLPGTSGCLCMINNSRQTVEVVSTWSVTAMQDFTPPESCCGLRSGLPRWRQPGESEIHCAHFSGNPPERYMCRPIIALGNTLGILYVQCETDALVQSVQQRADGVRHLVQITGMAIATLNLRMKLEHQSIRDSLTGLFNRHFMQISLERELSRAARKKQTLAVLMLDVDHFKQFNDTCGHPAGDAVLREIAQLFQANTREEDVACRYGGEEFTILLPDVTVESARERAEQLLHAVANLRVMVEHRTYSDLTISIGIAFYPNDGDTAELLLRRADEALYRSKREGRNRLTVSQPDSVTR
jgi:diguanylate cyclase (GGDEF)-like protein